MEPIWQVEIDIFVMKDGVFIESYKAHWDHEVKPEHKELVGLINAQPPGTPILGVGFRIKGAWPRHFTYGIFL